MSQDRSLRTTIIVVCSTITVALIGWFSSYIAARFENARLITNLQMQREQAETNLRGVIFDQTMRAFLNEADTLQDRSKQLLQLELLSLNFGSTLSLAPLFVEFRRDLYREEGKAKTSTELETVQVYHKRLRSIARQVASKQFSSLALHGFVRDDIDIDLNDGEGFANGSQQFVWPRDQAMSQFGVAPMPGKDTDLSSLDPQMLQDLRNHIAMLECMQLNDAARNVEVTVSSPDKRNMTVNVQLKIWDVPSCGNSPESRDKPIVDQAFTLDYFNFPKIDNTRLTNNQRFALIMESYDEKVGKISMAAVIFPSEYASLSDRTGMKEAIKNMQDAIDAN